MYSEFDRYLLQFSEEKEVGDYWHDVGNLYASNLLASFSISDWQELLESVSQKSDAWVMRFCEVVGDFSSFDVLLALLSLFDRKDPDVCYLLLESVRSLAALDGEVAVYAKELGAILGEGGVAIEGLSVERVEAFKRRLIDHRD